MQKDITIRLWANFCRVENGKIDKKSFFPIKDSTA